MRASDKLITWMQRKFVMAQTSVMQERGKICTIS